MLEDTLNRIADALEALVELASAKGALTDAGNGAAEAPAPKATRRKKGDTEPVVTPPATDSAPAAAAETAPTATAKVVEPAAAAALTPTPAATAPIVPDLAKIQARATLLAGKLGKEKVLPLISLINPTGGNISSMTVEQQAGFWAKLDALELGVTAEADALS